MIRCGVTYLSTVRLPVDADGEPPELNDPADDGALLVSRPCCSPAGGAFRVPGGVCCSPGTDALTVSTEESLEPVWKSNSRKDTPIIQWKVNY